MKQLQFIQAVPDDLVFAWQTQVQLNNFRKYGYSEKARVLVFLPHNRIMQGFNPYWEEIEKQFPEAKFFYYKDEQNLLNVINRIEYIPLLRPYVLSRHFAEYPELENDAIFYHDSDILFTKELPFDNLINDDNNYLSYTGNRSNQYNYMCIDHYTGKLKNVRDDKKNFIPDPVAELLKIYDLPKERFSEADKETIGGAQYLLKNINSTFWEEIINYCIYTRNYLMRVNQLIMKGDTSVERENNGFQSWCADMIAIQFNLWRIGKETFCPLEMDFSWATDKYTTLKDRYIYHHAGGCPYPGMFDKRALKYVHNLSNPLEEGLNLNDFDPQWASYFYTEEIVETSKNLNKYKYKQLIS